MMLMICIVGKGCCDGTYYAIGLCRCGCRDGTDALQCCDGTYSHWLQKWVL